MYMLEVITLGVLVKFAVGVGGRLFDCVCKRMSYMH